MEFGNTADMVCHSSSTVRLIVLNKEDKARSNFGIGVSYKSKLAGNVLQRMNICFQGYSSGNVTCSPHSPGHIGNVWTWLTLQELHLSDEEIVLVNVSLNARLPTIEFHQDFCASLMRLFASRWIIFHVPS